MNIVFASLLLVTEINIRSEPYLLGESFIGAGLLSPKIGLLAHWAVLGTWKYYMHFVHSGAFIEVILFTWNPELDAPESHLPLVSMIILGHVGGMQIPVGVILVAVPWVNLIVPTVPSALTHNSI